MPLQMHDWTLRALNVDWGEGVASVEFGAPTGRSVLRAHGLHNLHIPRTESWGPSVSVNEAWGPVGIEGGLVRFSIEMQTGDVIELVARSFDLPPEKSPGWQMELIGRPYAPKIVPHAPESNSPLLLEFVEQYVRDRVALTCVVDEKSDFVEDAVDWLIIGDGSDHNRFIVTSYHKDRPLGDVIDFAREWPGIEGEVQEVMLRRSLSCNSPDEKDEEIAKKMHKEGPDNESGGE